MKSLEERVATFVNSRRYHYNNLFLERFGYFKDKANYEIDISFEKPDGAVEFVKNLLLFIDSKMVLRGVRFYLTEISYVIRDDRYHAYLERLTECEEAIARKRELIKEINDKDIELWGGSVFDKVVELKARRDVRKTLFEEIDITEKLAVSTLFKKV